MSWLDKVNKELVIICGDGKEFRPDMIFTTKLIEYNVAEFDFPELSGTLVRRNRPRGTRHQMEIYFQGENHLEEALAFEISAADSRPWQVRHPLYGEIIVQPLSLLIDNSAYNVSKITGPVVETLTTEAPRGQVSPRDKAVEDCAKTDSAFADAFANDVRPVSADATTFQNISSKTYQAGSGVARLREEADAYFNAFNAANSAINKITSEPLAAMRLVQEMIDLPSLFSITVKNRLNTVLAQFNLLRTGIGNIINFNDKKIYEATGAAFLVAMAKSAVTPATPSEARERGDAPDYGSRLEVVKAAEMLMESYALYLVDMDALMAPSAAVPGAFTPAALPATMLSDLISYSVSSLLSIAMTARQERIVILEDDTNVLMATHRFYGLTSDDSTIEEFIRNNDIGPAEILSLRKGRKISYFI